MKILGYEVAIRRDRTHDELGGAIGQWLPLNMEIQVASDICPQQADSTVLHEVIEAINSILALDLEERQIMGLEAGLHQVLMDNGIGLTNLDG